MNKHGLIQRTLVALMALALVTACGGGSTNGSAGDGSADPTGPADTSAVLNTANVVVFDSLDPHMAKIEILTPLSGLYWVYDSLFVLDGNGDPQGRLVENWSYGPDGKTLDLTLRQGATFRDGTPLDAAAVKVNLDRARTLDSPVVKSRMSPVVDVQVQSPYSLELTLSTPTPVMPYVLAESAGYIMNPVLIESGNPATETNGSGAYSVESFTPKEKVTYVRDRDDYWKPEDASFAKVTYQAITDSNARINAFATGQIDIGQNQPDEVASLANNDDLHIDFSHQAYGVDFYLNNNKKPLDDLKVRQAINYAYDRKAVVDVVFPGSDVRWQQAREGLDGFDDSAQDAYPYDPGKAKQLLTEAGYPDGIDLGEILVSSSLPTNLDAIMQEQLGEAGIKIALRRTDSVSLYPLWRSGENSGMLSFAEYGTEFSSGVTTRYDKNQPGGASQELRDLLAAGADSRLTPEDRDAAYQKVDQYLVDNAIAAPIAWVNYPWPVGNDIAGFDPSVMNYGNTVGPFDFRGLHKVSATG